MAMTNKRAQKRQGNKEPQPKQPAKPEQWPRLKKVWSFVLKVWKGFASTAAAVALIYGLSPHMTIDPSVNLDSGDLLGTQFTITNVGRLSAHNVTFACRFDVPPNIADIRSENIGRTIPVLQGGRKVTRGCNSSIRNFPYLAKVEYTVRYYLPFVPWWQLSDTAYFSNRRTVKGELSLVPDTD
jgi:hypothetical protein